MNGIMLAATLAGTLVVFGYLVVIWWLDRYEREPFWMALLAFAWGSMGGWSLGCLCSLPFAIAAVALGGEAVGAAVSAVLVAPVVEEITKGLVFPLLLLTRHLDNETDGLIYGAAAGLGFAAIENVTYAIGFAGEGTSTLLALVFIRTFFTAIVHCISSGILGLAIGYACHRSGPSRWVLWPAAGLALAILNHMVWNALATASEFQAIGPGSPLLGVLGMLIVVVAAAAMFGLTQWSLLREHRVIQRRLLEESARGTLPAAHAAIIPYWWRRRKRDWLPASVPHAAYLRAATLLAFRHHQLEVARGERRERYLADIARLRLEVMRLLGPRVV